MSTTSKAEGKVIISVLFALKFGIIFFIAAIASICVINAIVQIPLQLLRVDIGQSIGQSLLSIVEIIPSMTLSAWVALVLTARGLRKILSISAVTSNLGFYQNIHRTKIPIDYALRFGIMLACRSVIMMWFAHYPVTGVVTSLFRAVDPNILLTRYNLIVALYVFLTVTMCLILSVKYLVRSEAEKLRQILSARAASHVS